MNFEPPRGVSRVTLGLHHPESYLTKLFLASKTPSITATFDGLSGILNVAEKSAGFKQLFDITNVLQRVWSHSHTHNLTSMCPPLLILARAVVIYFCNSSIYQYVSSIDNKLRIIKYSVASNPIILLQPRGCVWLHCIIQRDITDYLIFTQIIIKLDIPARWSVQCWIHSTLIGFTILFSSKATLFSALPKQTRHTFIAYVVSMFAF